MGEEAAPERVWHGLAAGALSGLASRACTHPLDTPKARLQVQGALRARERLYAGTWDAIRQTAAGEGLRGFYKGFGPVLLFSVPGTMAYYAGYETGKQVVPEGFGVFRDGAVGVVAQLFAGAIFAPMDILKERMQVQHMLGARHHYTSTFKLLVSSSLPEKRERLED